MKTSTTLAILSTILVLGAFLTIAVNATDYTIRADTTLAAIGAGILTGIAWGTLGYLDALRKPVDSATGKPPVFEPMRFLRTVALGAILGFFVDFSAPLSESDLVSAIQSLVVTAGAIPVVQKLLGTGQLIYKEIDGYLHIFTKPPTQ